VILKVLTPRELREDCLFLKGDTFSYYQIKRGPATGVARPLYMHFAVIFDVGVVDLLFAFALAIHTSIAAGVSR